MNTQELIKLLKRNGCRLDYHGKRHDMWYSRKTDKVFPVPRHKTEIATGTLKSILKDSGIDK